MTIPPLIILELTYHCNHSCRFCCCPWLRHESLYGKELDTCDWFRILDWLCRHGVKDIMFTGGEATLKKDFAEILRYASSLPFREVSVFTNGTTWDDAELELFRECHVKLATSLPGFFSYQALTGAPGNSRNILEKIRCARERGLEVSVSITVTRQNLPELPFTVLMAYFYHASCIQLQACAPEGRALEHPEMIPTDRQYKKIFRWAKFFNWILKIPVTFCYEQRCECYDLEGKPSGTIPETCTAGKDFMVISPDGRLRKCLHAPEVMGNIFTLMKDANE